MSETGVIYDLEEGRGEVRRERKGGERKGGER